MGFFDFLKKKEQTMVEFKEMTNNDEYSPWASSNLPRNDNYAIAAFVAFSQNGAKVGKCNDDYPRYFNYEYRVNDPIKYHKKVINEGFLVEAEPSVALKTFKVNQLKEILEKHNLNAKGKKDELIAMIVNNIDLQTLGLDIYYVPSEKGMEHLKNYDYIFYLKNYDISFEQYDSYKSRYQYHVNPNDIIWHILNERFNARNLSADYGLARNELLNMAKVLENEKRYIDALFHFVLVLYYDTSGCGNNNCVEIPEHLIVAPYIINSIHKLKGYYDDRILDKCYLYHLPHHYISKGNFHALIMDIFEDEPIDINKYIVKGQN